MPGALLIRSTAVDVGQRPIVPCEGVSASPDLRLSGGIDIHTAVAGVAHSIRVRIENAGSAELTDIFVQVWLCDLDGGPPPSRILDPPGAMTAFFGGPLGPRESRLIQMESRWTPDVALAAWAEDRLCIAANVFATRPAEGAQLTGEGTIGPCLDAHHAIALVAVRRPATKSPAVAIWTGPKGVQAASYHRLGSFAATQPLAASAPFELPAVAVNVQGDAVAAWAGADGLSIHIASRAAGQPFGAAQVIARELGGRGPAVVLDRAGAAVVAWTERRLNSVFLVSASRAPGGVFGTLTSVHVGHLGFAPQLAFTPQGTCIVIWMGPHAGGPGWSLHAAVHRPDGGLQDDRAISSPFAETPRLVVDRGGNASAIWAARQIDIPTGDVTPFRVQSARRRAADGVFGPFQDVDPAAPILGGGTPDIAVDGQGNAVAVWSVIQGGSDRIQSAFCPAGAAFGAVRTLALDARARNPRIALGEDGRGLAIWEQAGRIAVTRCRPGGVFDPARLLGDGHMPQIALDTAGDGITVWARTDGTVVASFCSSDGSFAALEPLSTPGQDVASLRIAMP